MPKGKTSAVWNYFEIIDDNFSHCNLCKKQISYKTSTSNLKRHLERRHGLWNILEDTHSHSTKKSQKYVPVQKEPGPSTSASTSNKSSNHVKRSFVWNYFSTEDGSVAFCSLCKKTLSYKTSTTNLKRHLERRHPSIKIPDGWGNYSSENSTNEKREELIHIISEAVDDGNIDDFKQHKIPNMTISDNHSKTRIEHCLLDLFTQDFQPFSIVEDTGFQKFVNSLNPTYILPKEKLITDTLLPALYEKTHVQAQEIVQEARSVTVTIDCWTSVDTEYFMAVTAHFLTENFDMKSVLLECASFIDELSSSSLAVELKRILEVWGLENKILLTISDNTTEIQKAITDELNWTHFSCYVHTLNVIIQNGLNIAESVLTKVRTWVTHFKHYASEYAQLCDIQKGLEKDSRKLIHDTTMRWNSTFYMIERFLEIEEALCTYVTLIDSSSTSIIGTEEWQLLKDIKKVLEPMECVTKIMTSKKYINISSIVILTKGLEKIYIEIQGGDMSSSAKQIASEFANGIQNHLGDLENSEKLLVSTFLDPRFKNVGFSSDAIRDSAKTKVECLVSDKIKETTLTSSKEQILDNDIKIIESDMFSVWSHFDQKVAAVQHADTFLSRAITEVERYVEDTLLKRNGDPLTWWREHSYIYPNLTQVAIEHLGTVATSVPCERLLSERGEIMRDRRSRLGSDVVKELVFLNVNTF